MSTRSGYDLHDPVATQAFRRPSSSALQLQDMADHLNDAWNVDLHHAVNIHSAGIVLVQPLHHLRIFKASIDVIDRAWRTAFVAICVQKEHELKVAILHST